MPLALIFSGVAVMILGSFFTDVIGVGAECAEEVATKMGDMLPAFVGSALAWWGGTKLSGRNFLGKKL